VHTCPPETTDLQDFRVSEGTRTPDRLDHNQELYQLSYAHQGSAHCAEGTNLAPAGARAQPSGL
jgi:hypothetical protein